MISKSGLKPEHARCFINVLVEGNEHTSRKLNAIIEDDKEIKNRVFTGIDAYQEAKQWIKQNL